MILNLIRTSESESRAVICQLAPCRFQIFDTSSQDPPKTDEMKTGKGKGTGVEPFKGEMEGSELGDLECGSVQIEMNPQPVQQDPATALVIFPATQQFFCNFLLAGDSP